MSEQLVATRQVLTAEELLENQAEPRYLMEYVQRRAEAEVRQHALEQGLRPGRVRVTWECRVEAVCEPENVGVTPVESA